MRSNSEAPVIDFPKKLLENPMNISATWGAWSLASVVFWYVSWHRVHTYGSKIDTDYFNVINKTTEQRAEEAEDT